MFRLNRFHQIYNRESQTITSSPRFKMGRRLTDMTKVKTKAFNNSHWLIHGNIVMTIFGGSIPLQERIYDNRYNHTAARLGEIYLLPCSNGFDLRQIN